MIKHKAGAELGDDIILTKPIGLGAILAANMHAAADHSDFEEAILQMRKSNECASKIFADLGAHALTDVTGFGLAGHLIEMADGASLSAQIYSDSIPYLSGAIKALKAGIESTMAEPNSAFASRISNLLVRQENRLLFDPQTSGGLLAAIPARNSELALDSLRSNGYPEAKVIGTFIQRSDSHSIQLI
jgi:selenide,water dikinase